MNVVATGETFPLITSEHIVIVRQAVRKRAAELGFSLVGHKLELYGGVSLSFESIDDVDDSHFTRAYLVPGLEYKLARDLDLVAEVGLGINDDSPNYASAGLALYLR